MTILSFTAAGLMFSIAGAFILFRGFAFTSDAALAAEAVSGKERIAKSVDELAVRRVDVRFGAPLLVFGLYMQLLPFLGIEERPTAQFVLLAALALSLVYYGLMRGVIAHNDRDHVLRLLSSPSASSDGRTYDQPSRLRVVGSAAGA